jgi:D-sedoheptulose 7-phosphate isomerase
VLSAVESLRPSLHLAHTIAEEIVSALRSGQKILTCGNGGSALQACHFASELIGHFRRDRKPLPAVALNTDFGVLTAIANDYVYDDLFSRQVEALAVPGDILVVFSTSGNSANIVAAIEAAQERGAVTIAFTGRGGGRVAELADKALIVGSDETTHIQEGHLVLVHLVCEHIDASFAAA